MVPASRRRTRHNVTLEPATVSTLLARAAAAKDLGYESNLSREIDRAVDEAEGNLRTARHEFGNALNPLRLQLGFIKSELLSRRKITPDDLKPIEELVAKMAGRLAPAAK